MIEAFASGQDRIETRARGIRALLVQTLIPKINAGMRELQAYIITRKLHGQVLQQRTGNLTRNILQFDAVDTGESLEGTVGLGANAPYGLAHERGATIPDRVPVNAKALSWIGADGNRIFAMRAKGFQLPERSFMRSSLAENREQIMQKLRAGIREAGARQL